MLQTDLVSDWLKQTSSRFEVRRNIIHRLWWLLNHLCRLKHHIVGWVAAVSSSNILNWLLIWTNHSKIHCVSCSLEVAAQIIIHFLERSIMLYASPCWDKTNKIYFLFWLGFKLLFWSKIRQFTWSGRTTSNIADGYNRLSIWNSRWI